MKQFLVFIAAAIMMVGCSSPASIFDAEELNEVTLSQPQESANRGFFEADANALYDIAFGIYQVHIEFDYFVDALPVALLERLDEQCFPELEDIILALHFWYTDERCGDILIEWGNWSLFERAIAPTKWAYLFDLTEESHE